MKKIKRFAVNLHASRGTVPQRNENLECWNGKRVVTLYTGHSETAMYSHVSAIEMALMLAHDATAEIEIVEDGESRWIEYRDGQRVM
jgi:hypothetical protein